MLWLEPSLWGVAGGGAVEALDYVKSVRAHGRQPWIDRRGRPRPGVRIYLVATGLRVWVGAVAAAAGGATLHLTAWVALCFGAGAPALLEKVMTWIPLGGPGEQRELGDRPEHEGGSA